MLIPVQDSCTHLRVVLVLANRGVIPPAEVTQIRVLQALWYYRLFSAHK
jgi:hypothetical protein